MVCFGSQCEGTVHHGRDDAGTKERREMMRAPRGAERDDASTTPRRDDSGTRAETMREARSLTELLIHNQEAGREVKAEAQLPFCLYSLWVPTPWGALPTLRVGLPSFVMFLWKHSHGHTQRHVSVVILNPVRLTMKI